MRLDENVNFAIISQYKARLCLERCSHSSGDPLEVVMIIATIIQGGRLAEMDHQTDIPCLFQHSNETQIQSILVDQSLIDQAGQIPP